MAGDWIKMRTSLATDPAVISIAGQLDITEFEVVGILHHLWTWADTQSRDGHADGVTQKWINRYVHRDGFAEALVSVGWLIVNEAGIEFPNFERHNGETAKSRALAANRKQKQRSNVTPSVTKESRTQRDERVTREEKRREEPLQQQQVQPAVDEIAARQRFVMIEGWQPDEVSLATHLRMIGVAAEQVTPQVVAEFVSYWMTRDTANNQGGWCRELVASIKRTGVRASAVPAARPGRTSQHVGLAAQDTHAGLEANPDGTYKL